MYIIGGQDMSGCPKSKNCPINAFIMRLATVNDFKQ